MPKPTSETEMEYRRWSFGTASNIVSMQIADHRSAKPKHNKPLFKTVADFNNAILITAADIYDFISGKTFTVNKANLTPVPTQEGPTDNAS